MITLFNIFYSVADMDYEPLNLTVTFQKEDVVKHIRVRIIDNEVLQQKRAFSAIIEVVQGLFPATVQNNTASIEISDDDSKLNLVPCMWPLYPPCSQ